MVAKTRTVRKGHARDLLGLSGLRDYNDVTMQVTRGCRGRAPACRGALQGQRVALSYNKGLGVLGGSKGWGTVGALRCPSVALGAMRGTWLHGGGVQGATL